MENVTVLDETRERIIRSPFLFSLYRYKRALSHSWPMTSAVSSFQREIIWFRQQLNKSWNEDCKTPSCVINYCFIFACKIACKRGCDNLLVMLHIAVFHLKWYPVIGLKSSIFSPSKPLGYSEGREKYWILELYDSLLKQLQKRLY